MKEKRSIIVVCVILLALVLASVYITDAQKAVEPNKDNSSWVDRLVDVGGHRLYIRYKGEGSPVVVIDSGIGETHRSWENLTEEIANETRVCVFDRAGYGESEPGPFPRTAQQEARELFSLLSNAGIKPPYLLVGHSLGALHCIVLAATHPELISGMLLVDPPPLGFITRQRFPNMVRMAEEQTREFERFAKMHRQNNQEREAIFFETIASEHDMMISRSAEQVAEIDNLGDMPMVVVGSGRPNPLFGDSAQVFQSFWIESNKKLASLSKRGSFVLAEDASHHVHLDAPQILLEAIRELIASKE